ncbi:MAG TPA: hypothetical protein VIG06_01060 [Kofleriaceae bacterium]|jgi:hypothetical protein
MNCTTINRTPHLDRILARQRRLLVTDFVMWTLIATGALAVLLAV